jgi:preprotein translocase SecE subunit
MALTTNNNGKTMATDVAATGAEEPDDRGGRQQQPQRAEKAGGAGGAGFFTIYKKGQGYWTRIATALAAALIIGYTAWFLYDYLPPLIPWLQGRGNWRIGIVAGVTLGMSLLVWRMMNKPSNVDFLIATDSEMKKVNWTTRRELVGSTKVVIGFMFLVALVLFLIDQYFTRLFYVLGVLMTDAPIWASLPNAFARVVLDIVTSVIVWGGAVWAIYGTSRRK